MSNTITSYEGNKTVHYLPEKNQQSALCSLPTEILLDIIERVVLSTKDLNRLKQLRTVCRTFNHTMSLSHLPMIKLLFDQVSNQYLKQAKGNGLLVFCFLCQHGIYDQAMLFTDLGFSPHMNKNQPLNNALTNGHENIIEGFLLKNKIHPLIYPDLMKYAIEQNFCKIVSLILQKNGVDPLNQQLMVSVASNGNVEMMYLLLDHLEKLPEDLSFIILKVSAGANKPEFFKFLFHHEKCTPAFKSHEQNELLKIAVEAGASEIVELLLDTFVFEADVINQAFVSAASLGGRTLLNPFTHSVLEKGIKKIAQTLLKHPFVNPTIQNLKDAIACGNKKVVKLLLKDSRVHPNPPEDRHFAAKKAIECGQKDILPLLFSDKRVGRPGILFKPAVKKRNLEIIKILLQYGVNPSVEKNIALRSAVKMKDVEIVRELLRDFSVNPSAENNFALYHALYWHCIDIAKALLNDPRLDLSLSQERIIKVSFDRDHLVIFELLLKSKKIFYSQEQKRYLLYKFVKKGHSEMVTHFLYLENMEINFRELLEVARQANQQQVIEIVRNYLDGGLLFGQLSQKRNYPADELLSKRFHRDQQ